MSEKTKMRIWLERIGMLCACALILVGSGADNVSMTLVGLFLYWNITRTANG